MTEVEMSFLEAKEEERDPLVPVADPTLWHIATAPDEVGAIRTIAYVRGTIEEANAYAAVCGRQRWFVQPVKVIENPQLATIVRKFLIQERNRLITNNSQNQTRLAEIKKVLDQSGGGYS